MWKEYRRKRYGIKSCTNDLDKDLLADLRESLIRAQELDTCDLRLGEVATLEIITERVNTI